MATALDYERLRRDLGVTSAELSDSAAEALFVEAEGLYASDASRLAGTRVIALQGMLAEAAHDVSYTQNNASESLSDRFKNLQSLLALWQQRLSEALILEETEDKGIHPPASHTVRLKHAW